MIPLANLKIACIFSGFAMKLFSLLLIATSLTLTNGLHAQEQKASTTNLAEVETKWPGVLFAISRLERIQDNRLLVFVRVIATSKAARSGTFLGTRPAIPPGASKEDIATDLYNAKPFSLASAVMTDDQTQQKYPVLPPVAPPGKEYFPGELANGLLPGQGETLTIQFAAPPCAASVGRRKVCEADGFFCASQRQRAYSAMCRSPRRLLITRFGFAGFDTSSSRSACAI